jgi:hypothetical protein
MDTMILLYGIDSEAGRFFDKDRMKLLITAGMQCNEKKPEE